MSRRPTDPGQRAPAPVTRRGTGRRGVSILPWDGAPPADHPAPPRASRPPARRTWVPPAGLVSWRGGHRGRGLGLAAADPTPARTRHPPPGTARPTRTALPHRAARPARATFPHRAARPARATRPIRTRPDRPAAPRPRLAGAAVHRHRRPGEPRTGAGRTGQARPAAPRPPTAARAVPAGGDLDQGRDREDHRGGGSGADPHLAGGGVIVPSRLAPATRDVFLELAAVIADGFGGG